MRPLNLYSKLLLFLVFNLLVLTGFTQHVYPVSSNTGHCGFIDTEGNLVIDTSYNFCTYNKTYQWVIAKKRNCFSFLSNNGTPLSPCYDSISNHNEQLYFGQTNTGVQILLPSNLNIKPLTIVDSTGLVLKGNRLITVYKDSTSFLVSTSGAIYFRKLRATKISRISKEHFWIEKNHHVGIYDLHSKPYLKADYDSIQAYKSGLKFYKNGKVGFKKEFFYLNSIKGDRSNLSFPAIYDGINYFGQHYLLLVKGKQNILYHIKNKKIITTDFNLKAKPLCELYHKFKQGRKYGLCNVKGTELTPPIYNKLLDSKRPDRIIYIKDRTYGFMDSKGTELTDNNFDKIFPFSEKGILPRTFTKYERNEKMGLVSIDGDTITSPIYENIRLISDDRAACMRLDSSARIFILNKSTGKLDDWYDIVHIKQLGIRKYYSHAGTENLFTKIAPIDNKYFSHKIFNNEASSNKPQQYNLTNYSNITTTRTGSTKLFFNYILNDQSLAPNDEQVCILSVNNELRKGYKRYKPAKTTKNYYRTAQFYDKKYIKTINHEGKKSYFNIDLDPFSFSYKKEKFRVLNIEKGNSYYPQIFKVVGHRKSTNYMIPTKDYKKQLVPPGYKKLILNDTLIFGKKGAYWYCINNDSLKLPNKTVNISTADSMILSTQQDNSYYIYDNQGIEKNRFDSLKIINQSKNGMILVQIDSGYNYLNPSGELILNSMTTNASPFINGLANIKTNNKYSVINNKGTTVITNMNKELRFNTKGVAVYYNKRKFGLIDTTGKLIDTSKYVNYQAIKNTYLYQFKTNKTDKFGIKNFDGKTIHENFFNKIKKLDSNLFIATEKNTTYLIHAKTGSILLKIKKGKVKAAGNNTYLINKGSKWGLYSASQEWILPLKYTTISRFNASDFATFKKKKEVGYILTDNSIVSSKPAKNPYTIKDTTTVPLHLDLDSVYVGIQSINIPIRYNKIIQLNNGCYLATRHHQFILYSFNDTSVLSSDTWTNAKIIDKNIMQVHTSTHIKYYNLVSKKWVWR